MLSFAPRLHHYSQPIYPVSVYPHDNSYTFSRPLVTDFGVRYRRALVEYFSAEEEYKALLRAREEAKLRARLAALGRRREWTHLLHKQQQVRQRRRALANALAPAEVSEDNLSLHHIVPVMCGTTSERPLSPSDAVVVPAGLHTHEPFSDGAGVENRLSKSRCDFVSQSSAEGKVGGICILMVHWSHYPSDQHQPPHDVVVNTAVNQPPHLASELQEPSVPNLESLLRERLQKIGGDDEVQDVARDILRHLTSVTSQSTATSKTEVGHHFAFSSNDPLPTISWQGIASSTQPSEGADLSRSDALQGAAAEIAKASFKAHRAESAKGEGEDHSASSPTSKAAPSHLTIIQDIRSSLAKLSSAFSLPSSLDFSDDEADGLAYTARNVPVREYEHALDELLVQLDAVESDGDEEVRDVRRAAVREVEKAIEDVERKIREAREDAKPGSRLGAASSAEAELTKGEDVVMELPVDEDSKLETDESSSSILDDHSESGFSSPGALPLPDSEVVLPHDDADLTSSESALDEDILKVQSLTDVSELNPPALTGVVTPTLAPIGGQDETSVSTGDTVDSKHEVFASQETTDQTTSTPPGPSLFAMSLDRPVEVSTPIPGAIPPSSTPVSPVSLSSSIPEDFSASLSRDWPSVSPGLEGEDGSSPDDDDEREWIEIEA